MSSSRQVRGCLALERERRDDEAGANVMVVFILDCGDGLIVYTNFRTLNLCSLLYIIYTLVKLALKEEEKSALMNLLEGSHLSSGLHLADCTCVLSDDSFRMRNTNSAPSSFSSNTSLPSTSRGTGNSVDPKSSGSKDTQPRKATL